VPARQTLFEVHRGAEKHDAGVRRTGNLQMRPRRAGWVRPRKPPSDGAPIGWLLSFDWHFVRRLRPATRFPAPLWTTLSAKGLGHCAQRGIARDARHSEWAGGGSCRAVEGRTDGPRSRARASRAIPCECAVARARTAKPGAKRRQARAQRSARRHAARSRESGSKDDGWGLLQNQTPQYFHRPRREVRGSVTLPACNCSK
jgi:hypothetical protein